MHRRPFLGLPLVIVFVALLAPASPRHTAEATSHGMNGRIAFSHFASSEFHIWTMNPDGRDRDQFY